MSIALSVRNNKALTIGSTIFTVIAVSVTTLLGNASLHAFEINSLKDATDQAGHSDAVVDGSLEDRLNKLEQSHAVEIERLERRVQELEELTRRLQREAKMQPSPENGLAFEQRRLANWARVSDGMERQDVYRLLGRGIKDTKTITSECRCYTLGRICFDDKGYSTKTEARCQL